MGVYISELINGAHVNISGIEVPVCLQVSTEKYLSKEPQLTSAAPIPLTDEWVARLGVERMGKIRRKVLYKYRGFSFVDYGFEKYPVLSYGGMQIHYVHQLEALLSLIESTHR